MFLLAQNQLHKQRDKNIEQIGELARQIKMRSFNISQQLQKQDRQLKQWDGQMDVTIGRFGIISDKLKYILDSKDPPKILACCFMVLITLILVLLICIF